MRYAVISDIHGNLPALEAVLADAARQGCTRHLFLGDYIQDLPYPNEIAQRLMQLPDAAVIAGNKELHYLRLIAQMLQAGESPRQFAAMFWNFAEMTPKTLAYYQALPKSLTLQADNGTPLFLSHDFQDFFKSYHRWQHSSRLYTVRMDTRPFTHTDYLAQMQRWFSQNSALQAELQYAPNGIYLFGHSHLQWHVRLEGKLLVNPGSCGTPLDLNPDAAYTILESHADQSWHIAERRVPYDIPALIHAVKHSSLYPAAPLWCDLVFRGIKAGRDELCVFFHKAKLIAEAYGVSADYYPEEIWALAEEDWYRRQKEHLENG